jgi:RNA polymerase sigma factor (sigma-70 family)
MTAPRKKVLAERTEVERVARAAAALSALERDILLLSAGHRLRNAEIAARLGLTERRVERLLARALRKFDRALVRQDQRWWKCWWMRSPGKP